MTMVTVTISKSNSVENKNDSIPAARQKCSVNTLVRALKIKLIVFIPKTSMLSSSISKQCIENEVDRSRVQSN